VEVAAPAARGRWTRRRGSVQRGGALISLRTAGGRHHNQPSTAGPQRRSAGPNPGHRRNNGMEGRNPHCGPSKPEATSGRGCGRRALQISVSMPYSVSTTKIPRHCVKQHHSLTEPRRDQWRRVAVEGAGAIRRRRSLHFRLEARDLRRATFACALWRRNLCIRFKISGHVEQVGHFLRNPPW
jgi:hypothetical protein